MPVKFPLTANVNSLNNSDIQPSDACYSVTISATTDTTLVVPTASDLGGSNTSTNNYLIAVIRHKPNNDVWFANNATAAVPGGSSFASTTSQLLTNGTDTYKVKSGDTLHFYTAASNVVISVCFYWL